LYSYIKNKNKNFSNLYQMYVKMFRKFKRIYTQKMDHNNKRVNSEKIHTAKTSSAISSIMLKVIIHRSTIVTSVNLNKFNHFLELVLKLQ